MADQVGRNGETLPRKVGSRKSIAHTQSWPTTLGEDKENMTADVGEMTGMKRKSMPTDRPSKKSRSKSIGPGGVDGLKEAARNQQKVLLLLRGLPCWLCRFILSHFISERTSYANKVDIETYYPLVTSSGDSILSVAVWITNESSQWNRSF